MEPLKPIVKERIFRRDNYECVYCGASRLDGASVKLHADHITPYSRGGDNVASNIVTACSTCNIVKSAALDSANITKLVSIARERNALHGIDDRRPVRDVRGQKAGKEPEKVYSVRLSREDIEYAASFGMHPSQLLKSLLRAHRDGIAQSKKQIEDTARATVLERERVLREADLRMADKKVAQRATESGNKTRKHNHDASVLNAFRKGQILQVDK